MTSPPSTRDRVRVDDALSFELAERLANDRRTAHLDLEADVRGGVAHVRGVVGSRDERALVRRLVRGLQGVHAAWDLLELPGEELAIADVGCGGRKQVPEAVGVDAVDVPGVDVVADLDDGLPFADGTFDHVFAVHVLEHVADLVAVMDELHRVLRQDGVLHVLAPYWRHVNAVTDPTHRRYLDVTTFGWLCVRDGGPWWTPLAASASEDTVHVDLERATELPPAEVVARWFPTLAHP